MLWEPRSLFRRSMGGGRGRGGGRGAGGRGRRGGDKVVVILKEGGNRPGNGFGGCRDEGNLVVVCVVVCSGGDGGILQGGGDVNWEIGTGGGCVNVDNMFGFSVVVADKVNDFIISIGRHCGHKE